VVARKKRKRGVRSSVCGEGTRFSSGSRKGKRGGRGEEEKKRSHQGVVLVKKKSPWEGTRGGGSGPRSRAIKVQAYLTRRGTVTKGPNSRRKKNQPACTGQKKGSGCDSSLPSNSDHEAWKKKSQRGKNRPSPQDTVKQARGKILKKKSVKGVDVRGGDRTKVMPGRFEKHSHRGGGMTAFPKVPGWVSRPVRGDVLPKTKQRRPKP